MNFYTLIFKPTLSYRKFISSVLFVFLTIGFIIGGINWGMDPLRMFGHSHALNNKQVDFDERQQKTNFLYFVNRDYDSILLGSSRSTYIDQNLFGSEKVFNYAANNMNPYEYTLFIDNFIKITGHAPKKIYIGMDFFGTNIYRNPVPTRNFLANTISSNYRFKKLLSIKLFQYSIKNIKQNIKETKPYYTRQNVKSIPQTYLDRAEEQMKVTSVSFEKYKYDENISQAFKQLKEKYKDSEFVIFTTPIYYKRLENHEMSGLHEYYVRWLNELVQVFGEVNHFMYYNEFTAKKNNYFDASHFKPSSAHLLTTSILKRQDNEYMILLNANNLESFLLKYSRQRQKVKKMEKLDAL